jgi:hypothetical protein
MQHFGDGNKGVRLDPTHLLRKFRKLHTRVLRVNSALQRTLRVYARREKQLLHALCLSVRPRGTAGHPADGFS